MCEISTRNDDRDKLQEMSAAKHDQSYSETECKRETREKALLSRLYSINYYLVRRVNSKLGLFPVFQNKPEIRINIKLIFNTTNGFQLPMLQKKYMRGSDEL